ncbi:two-component system, unclassified family, sensor histidine kinase and response regulator [Prosthecobacter debontii]|uniref:histidine kinase n=1 Tax=Prosthecobacter debontii TaxID=48467 RepID=A0A1T4WZF8_9BACT|nr:hybrid sensor histidine kinase/response regulator [Prosthecobacter debontii]SKA82255.1 two-component system, unclassified family, sensor histidine kinase and response regulator [Prosthecobacter debontii]
MPHQSSNDPGRTIVMVVDDQPQNVKLVSELLTVAMGYQVLKATSGQEALSLLKKTLPDLILLDVLMPEQDGVETCKIIKEKPEFADIPIIFLSAADDKNLIVQALESGGVDYVTKPFSRAELLTRVRTHLALKHARDSLKALAEDKDELLGILTHDLKNHLGGMQMSAQLLQDRMSSRLNDEKFTQLVDNILQNTTQMLAFVKEFLANSMAERVIQFNVEPVNLAQAAHHAVRQYQLTAERKDIELICQLNHDSSAIEADPSALKQILDNLISNAIKFSPSNRKIYITVAPVKGDCVECCIRDEGPGFTDEDKLHMFRRYARLTARPTAGEPSTGLGLSIVKKLVEAMNGHLRLDSTLGQGSAFTVRLPKARKTPSRQPAPSRP